MKKIFLSAGVFLMTTLCMTAMARTASFYSADNNDTQQLTLTQTGESGAVDAAQVVTSYLLIKDALVAGDKTAAAKAAGALSASLKQLEKEATGAAQKKVLSKEGRLAIKGAQSISTSRDIKEQRAAFKQLSEQLYQILKVVGVSGTLYWDHCPMAKANWLSDKKPIANPYYGHSMLTCGSVKETLSN